MDAALADRLQFAFTVMFHYLFPVGTMGLAPFVAWYTYRAAKTGDPDLENAARFWLKIFAINFAAGVVTGIPMEFQFGTNWATFSARSGAVIGQPLAMEGIFAFFLESVFLGVLLYGRGVVAPAFHTFAAFCVLIGSWLSAYFIVATDAWMQAPSGYKILADGTIELVSIWPVLFSQFALWQFAHVLCGALVAGGFIVAGIGSYYLMSNREPALSREFIRTGTLVAFAFSALLIFPTGDRNSADVTHYQPIKLAAMEGLFESEIGAPMAIIGMPDVHARKLIDPIYVPDVLSFLAYGSASAPVKGLTAYADALWPPVELTYYAYHVMVGLGTIFLGVMAIATLALFRGRLFATRWLLWPILLLMPFPYVANEAGWIVSEVGRQPWIVYGIMKTAEGTSATVSQGETIFTLIGFLGMYFMLGLLFVYLVLREIASGPSNHATPVAAAAP